MLEVVELAPSEREDLSYGVRVLERAGPCHVLCLLRRKCVFPMGMWSTLTVLATRKKVEHLGNLHINVACYDDADETCS